MEPTVLAGAIEFSPAEIALIVAVLIAAFVVVTSPGWVVLAFVMGRLPAPGATPRRRWAARSAGAAAGLAISVAAGSLVGLVLDRVSLLLTVPVAWGACWALAALLHRRAPAPGSAAPVPSPVAPGPMLPPAPPATGEGWGR